MQPTSNIVWQLITFAQIIRIFCVSPQKWLDHFQQKASWLAGILHFLFRGTRHAPQLQNRQITSTLHSLPTNIVFHWENMGRIKSMQPASIWFWYSNGLLSYIYSMILFCFITKRCVLSMLSVDTCLKHVMLVWFVWFVFEWFVLDELSFHICLLTVLALSNHAHVLPDDIFRYIFVNAKFCILIKMSLKFAPNGPIDNNPAFV